MAAIDSPSQVTTPSTDSRPSGSTAEGRLTIVLLANSVTSGVAGLATATDDFTNPMGEVLGGFLAAMLYDTVGPALLATLAAGQFVSTLELESPFLRPAHPGRLTGHGRVIHRVGTIAFLERVLVGPDDSVITSATATSRVVELS